MITATLIRHSVIASVAGLLALGSVSALHPASALELNSDFENDLNNWMTRGDVSVTAGNNSFGGNSTALLTTASAIYADDYPLPTGAFNFSGVDPAFVSIGDSPLENFLGVPLGSLKPNSTQGSAIKRTLTVREGDQLFFDWNFLTNEVDDLFLDYAFVMLEGFTELANTSTSLFSSNTPFAQETGFRRFSHTFSSAGTYTLAIGVVDAIDLDVSSALLVDNVKLMRAIPEPTPVPEPVSGLGISLFGVLGAAFTSRRIIKSRVKFAKL